MPTIVPWIIPPNYPQIMEAGAQTGLAIRRMNEASRHEDATEALAGDRLRLAYDTLASQEKRASEAASARRDAAMAAALMRQRSIDALQIYRAGLLREKQIADERATANQLRLADQFAKQQAAIESRFTRGEQRKGDEFESREGGIQSRFDMTQGQREAQFQQQQERLRQQFADTQAGINDRFSSREQRIREMYGEGQESAGERADKAAERAVGRMQLAAGLRDLADVKKQMEKIEATGGPARTGLFWTSTKQIKEYEALKKRKEAIENELESVRPAAAGLVRGNAKSNYRTVTNQEEFDALQPGEVYVGSGGKLYRKP